MSSTQEATTDSDEMFDKYNTSWLNMKVIGLLIRSAWDIENVRGFVSVLHLTFRFRPKLTAHMLSDCLKIVLIPADSENYSRLSSFLSEGDTVVDTARCVVPIPKDRELLPETYCNLLVLLFLIDQKKYNKAKMCALGSINQIKLLDGKKRKRRTLRVIASRLYFYSSYCFELAGDLSQIRRDLLELLNKSISYHDEIGQEMLINLLLRNYLHYNLYDQAEMLRSKAPRFDAHTNSQLCRYHFYLGKIRTIRFEYTDAKESLLQAIIRAPVAARGFRIQCNKWTILVCLLLVEIPERSIFAQKGMEKALRPYLELTNAIRVGDLELFRNVAEKFDSTFSTDKTRNLIVRLRHSVIWTGLRNISFIYSRISFADVAKKLRLNSETPVADVESIIAKAIRYGAIDATLDHANGWMLSKDPSDIYSTNEPKTAFHFRIIFCFYMHNEAVRALYFPQPTSEEISWARTREQKLRKFKKLY